MCKNSNSSCVLEKTNNALSFSWYIFPFSISGRNNCETTRQRQGPGFLLNVPANANSMKQPSDKQLFNFHHLITDRSHVPVTTIHHHQNSFPPTFDHNTPNQTYDPLRQRAVIDNFKTAFPLTSGDSSQDIAGLSSATKSQVPETSIQVMIPSQSDTANVSIQQEVLSQTNGDQHDEANKDDEVFQQTTKKQRLEETTESSALVPFYRNFNPSDAAKNDGFPQSRFYHLNEIYGTDTRD